MTNTTEPATTEQYEDIPQPTFNFGARGHRPKDVLCASRREERRLNLPSTIELNNELDTGVIRNRRDP